MSLVLLQRSGRTRRASVVHMSVRAFVRQHRVAFVRAALVAIVVLGTLPRLYHVAQPYFLDLHAWRQADSAAFTRGYLIESFNLFDPSISRHPCTAAATQFGRVEAELPITAFVAAAPLKLLGVRDADARYIRLTSIAFFILGCVLLYGCVVELGGKSADALLAVAAFCAAPLCIFFTRSPQPDGPALTLAIGTVWATARYARRRGLADAAIAALFATSLLLLKISNAYLLPVFAYVLLQQLGWAALRDRKLWLALLVVCGATAAWYVHAHSFGWTFGIWGDVADSKFSKAGQLRNPETWQRLLAKLSWDILTVGGCILGIIGLVVRRHSLLMRVCFVWLACALLFIVLTLNGQLRHVYYQLAVVPPAVIAQAAGIRHLFAGGWTARATLTSLLALHAAIAWSVLWGSSPHASAEGQSYFTEDLQLRAPIDALRAHVPAQSLIVSSERDPRLYWNADRRGYFFEAAPMAEVLRCMDRAGDYLLVGPSARRGLTSYPAFHAEFVPLWRSGAYALYRRTQHGPVAQRQ